MGDFVEADPEREKKRKKALRRMGKILGRAWELPQAEHFHGSLGDIGDKLDQAAYRYGRHGWEDFAKDIGGVYNRHIHRYVMVVRDGCTGRNLRQFCTVSKARMKPRSQFRLMLETIGFHTMPLNSVDV